jgi:hypothetical protein
VNLGEVSAFALGMLLGLGYLLAELPNSYLKRRLGIPAGRPSPRYRAAFALLDQADSALGFALVYAVITDVPAAQLVLMVLLGPAIHAVANLTLYGLGLRKEAL